MAKELILYSGINRYSAETAVNQLNLIDDNEDLTVRINTPGGNVIDGWAVISRLSERTAKTNGVIDGQAASMGAMMLLFFDNVVANDTSLIMFHKAAYASWYDPSESEKALLDKINKQFEAKIKKKVSGKEGSIEFLAKLFEKDVRNDVELTMKEAKKLGIVNEIRTLQPKAYYGTQMVAMYEDDNLYVKANAKTPQSSGDNNNNLKIESMDLVKLKAEHPALYAQVLAEGKAIGMEAGEKKENARIAGWNVWAKVDLEKVNKGIESGNDIDAKSTQEFMLQMASGKKIEEIKDENADEPNVDKEKITAEQKEKAEAKAAIAAQFGDKPEVE